jgi:transaldolase
MTLFLDSAQLEEARKAAALGFVRGATTNPALLARAGHKDAFEAMRALAHILPGIVFYQVMGHSLEEMREEADRFMAIGANLGLKIPGTLLGCQFAAEVASHVTVAVTGVFSPGQAYLAAEAGAHYIIPYVNRMTRFVGDGPAIVTRLAMAVEGSACEVLAAGIKTPAEAMDTLFAGADHLSLPWDVIVGMAENALTEKAMVDFEAAWSASQPR